MCTTLSSTEPFLASKLMTTLLQNQILHSCVRYNHMSRLPMRFGKCRLGETWRHYGGPRTLVKQGNVMVEPPSIFCASLVIYEIFLNMHSIFRSSFQPDVKCELMTSPLFIILITNRLAGSGYQQQQTPFFMPGLSRWP